MPTRSVEAPGGRRSAYVTTEEAAEFLGISVATFRRLVGLDKSELTLPGVGEWVRPVPVGRGIRWHWLSIVYLAHHLAQRQPSAATTGDED